MNSVKLFESAQIRSVWNEADGRWYFSVADVVQALTDSANVRDYIKKMRKREAELDANWGTLCPPLELLAPDGKRRQTQCANAEGFSSGRGDGLDDAQQAEGQAGQMMADTCWGTRAMSSHSNPSLPQSSL